jgi:hypothetical protein
MLIHLLRLSQPFFKVLLVYLVICYLKLAFVVDQSTVLGGDAGELANDSCILNCNTNNNSRLLCA